jgi:hypothetical protein
MLAAAKSMSIGCLPNSRGSSVANQSHPPLEAGVYVNSNNNYIGTGNMFSMFSSTELFYLEAFFGEDPRLLMTLSQVREALANYVKVLAHGWRDENDPPAPFAFEYIAEGEDAHRLANEAGLFSVKH